MKIVPYEKLTPLQQAIAGWAGDKDGGCGWQTMVEFLTDPEYTDPAYDELTVKKEIVNMIKKKILVASVYREDNLHYPGWRPNESRSEHEANFTGYESEKTKTIIFPDVEYEEKVFFVTPPGGKEAHFSSLADVVSATGLDARMVYKAAVGVVSLSPYKIRKGTIKKTQKGGPRRVQVPTVIKPPKKPFDWEKAILGSSENVSRTRR